MLASSWMPPMRRAGLYCVAVMLATVMASAQSTAAKASSNAATFSSSQWSSSASTSSSAQLAELAMPANPSALPSAPVPASSAAGQGQYSNGGLWQRWKNNFAFEAGGGFNAPISSAITYGGNFTIGAGTYLGNPHLAALLEYQFISDKLPGALIAATQGASGGHAHIWSFTLDPVYDLFPKASNDLYVTGGGGFYRKVTTFTVLSPTQFCYYFYCGIGYAPSTVGHFSSNQGGWNFGGGYIHRMGGMYGTSKMKLFVEARYLDVLSPAITGQSANGLAPVSIPADTKLIPVTFGIRW